MIKHCLLVVLLSVPALGRAQDGFVSENRSMTYDVFDRNGKAFVNPAPDVAGSPFLFDTWRSCTVILTNHVRLDSVSVRINVLTQQVHVLDPHGNELELEKGYVTEILAGAPGSTSARYKTGFPAVDFQSTGNLYEVRASGKLWLLRSVRKIIAEKKNDMSGEINREYATYEDYYVFDGSKMRRVKKEKAWLLDLLADKKDSIAAFISTNKLKIKSYDEIQRTIDYYNSL